jgi:hypothetical protein
MQKVQKNIYLVTQIFSVADPGCLFWISVQIVSSRIPYPGSKMDLDLHQIKVFLTQKTSVADPDLGYCAFLTHGSGMGEK